MHDDDLFPEVVVDDEEETEEVVAATPPPAPPLIDVEARELRKKKFRMAMRIAEKHLVTKPFDSDQVIENLVLAIDKL